MNLEEITGKLSQVIEVYAKKFSIRCDDDWLLMKLQEELGELTSAYLKLTQRARRGDATAESLEKNFREEVADVLAITLLFAKARGIDPEKALQEKWFRHFE